MTHSLLVIMTHSLPAASPAARPVFKVGFAERDISPAIGMEQRVATARPNHRSFHDPCNGLAFEDGGDAHGDGSTIWFTFIRRLRTEAVPATTRGPCHGGGRFADEASVCGDDSAALAGAAENAAARQSGFSIAELTCEYLEESSGDRCRDLTFVRARYQSPYGTIASNWRLQSGVVHLDVTVPPGTTSTVHVPTTKPAAVTEGRRPSRAVAGSAGCGGGERQGRL